MEDKRVASRHSVTLDRRESMSVTGLLEVISFDEEAIIADTEMGVLVLRGMNLHVSRLNLESGELEVDGEIFSLSYEESGALGKGRGSFLSKLFK